MRQLRYMTDGYEFTRPLDVAKYMAAGRSILALKASEGTQHVDVEHAPRSRWTHSEGGTVLHYHFGRPDLGNRASAEAEHYLRVTKPLWKPGDYLCLDMERGLIDGMGTPSEWCEHFSEWCATHFGAHPIIYANESTLNGPLRNLRIPGERYWVAKYGDGWPHLLGRKKIWAWQFTDGKLGKQPHTAPGVGQCDQSLLPLWVAVPLAARTWRRRRAISHH